MQKWEELTYARNEGKADGMTKGILEGEKTIWPDRLVKNL